MNKLLLTSVTALSLSATSLAPAAYADCGTFGCNIIDEGTFAGLNRGDRLNYETGLLETEKCIVLQINTKAESVLCQNERGYQSWRSAQNLYSSESMGQRDVGKVVGALALLFLFASSSDSSSSGNGYDQGAAAANKSLNDRSKADSSNDTSSKPDTSVGCIWGDRAYGTCH